MKKVLNKNNILKGAGVLLIAAVMILSTVSVTANTKNIQKVVAPDVIRLLDIRTTSRDIILSDDFEDGDYTNNPTWTMISNGAGNGLEDWEIKTDPWTYAWGTVENHGTGYFMGSDSDAGGALADEYMVIDFDTDGVGDMVLEYWLHFRSYLSEIDEYFEVLVDDDQVDHIAIPGTNPDPFEGIRTVDLTAYNDGGTHTLTMHFYSDWGYVAAFDDVSIETGIEPAVPDLDCDGSLSWTEVEPGATVTGSFTVENIGDPTSELDWEIEGYPDWGVNWTFDPESGIDLTPEDGAVTVEVTVVAPEDPETEFTGEVKIVNSDDPSDFCIIDVSLATPVSQQSLEAVSSVVSKVQDFNLEKRSYMGSTGRGIVWDNGGPTTIQPILWDNGMNYLGLAAAQFDEAIPFDAFQADDFLFDESTDVYDVHWIGGYWSTDYATGDFDWGISFMVDDGTGNAPLGHPQTPSFAGPFYFTWDDIAKTLLEDTGSSIYYELGVDLPDNLLFAGGEKYWISIWGVGLFPPQSGWGYHEDPILLHQTVVGSDYFPWVFWTNSEDIFGFAHDQCFQLTGEGEPAIPDLDCDGTLSWEEVTPGETVTGTFTVENIGDPDSLLDWEIESYPEWGNWTFTPSSGGGLTPEDDPVTVSVSVVAPDESETEFEGEVKIVNTEDPDDFCIIDVSLATPVNQQSINSLFLRFLEQHPNIFPILRHLLGL